MNKRSAAPGAKQVLGRLEERYEAARDPAKAAPMAAYLRDQFPFLGIPGPAREALDREILEGLAPLTEAELVAVARACWKKPEREYQYFAQKLLGRRVKKVGTPALLPAVKQLIATKSWWDTVDDLAANVVGPLVAKFPELKAEMDAWSGSDALWVARAAILHQLKYRERTDARRLFSYCYARAEEKDFFFRKAIGWALRAYAATGPDAVETFVQTNRSRLSPLSLKEALRGVERARA